MARVGRIPAACAALAGAAASSQAQFSGPYAPASWILNPHGGDGSVITSGAPATIVVIGNDNGQPIINTDYTTTAAATGSWSFNWEIIPHDSGTYDAAYYLLNGSPFFIGYLFGGSGGVTNVPVQAGDVIGFRVWSADGAIGTLDLHVTNFSAPVPGPGGFIAVAAPCLLLARRRRSEGG